MKKSDALKLIKEIKDIEEAFVGNEKECEKVFKEAIGSCEPKRLISIIKLLYARKQIRIKLGKKCPAVDEKYFKLAEKHLYGELAFALGVEKSEVLQIIEKNVNI